MMHGMVPDSAVVGTVKRMNRKPRRKMGKNENTAVSVFALIAAILSF